MARVKWVFTSSLLMAALLLGACQPSQTSPDPETNKALLGQLAEVWSGGAPELLHTALSPDFVMHDAEFSEVQNQADYARWIGSIRAYIPDFKKSLSDIIAEDDWVVARGELGGTLSDQRQPVYGVLEVARIAEGQIAELWLLSDEFSVNKIFGEIPNPDQRVEFLWGDDSTVNGVTGTREENGALVRQWVEGGEAAPAELAHDAFMFHSTMYPEQHTFQDRAQIMADLRAAFPDLTITLEEPMIVEGDKVGVRFTMQGTNTGPFLDRKASGKAITWPGIAIYRVLDGKIAEEWILWSGYYLYSQIRGW